MRNVLVIGGAGFIGSHLVERLLLMGDSKVTVVDNLATGSRENLKGMPVSFLQQDTTGYGWRLLDEYDEVYHLGALASTRQFTAHPVEAFEAAVNPLMHVLEYACTRRTRVLFASSSEVYGEPEIVPTPEEGRGYVNPVGVRSGYDEGKRAGEALMAGYRREYGIDGRIVRIFNTYGPRQTADGRLVATMVRDALTKHTITVNAPGTQTRTLVHVFDTVTGIICAMRTEGAPFVVNIGGRETFTVRQVAEQVAEQVGHCTIISGPPVEEEPMRRVPDITLAKEKLGWFPLVSFREGLKTVIEYWEERV